MSGTLVCERWQGRQFRTDENGVEYFQRQFITETTSDEDGEDEAVAPIPVVLYDPHPVSGRSIARNIDVAPYEGPQSWVITVYYSSAPFPANAGGFPAAINPESPTPPSASRNNSEPAQNRPPVISITKKDVRIAIDKDVDGEPIKNTVGDKFEGIEIDKARMVINVKFFSVGLTIAHMRSYWNKINDDAWEGFPAGTLMCTDYNYTEVNETIATGVIAKLYEATLTIEYDPDGWNLKLMNSGKRAKGVIDDQIYTVVDESGTPVSDPVLLDENGYELGIMTSDPHILEFQVYQGANFDNIILQ
jgi:hypothetical protein